MSVPKDFILSTASSLEGYRVLKQCGVVFGESYFKHGFFKSLGAGISDTIDSLKFGSRELTGSTKLLEDARNYAYEKMIKEAQSRGANAIIALESDNTIGGDVMYLSLYGTAVKVVSEEDYAKELKIEKQREAERQRESARLEQEMAEKKRKLQEERNRYKAENGIEVSDDDIDLEDVFAEEMMSAKSVEEIWKAWLTYNLDVQHKQLDAYVAMKLESEKANGVPANLEDIKQAIIKMLEKDRNC